MWFLWFEKWMCSSVTVQIVDVRENVANKFGNNWKWYFLKTMCSQINIFGVLLEFICLSMIHMYDKKKKGGGEL